ncbi:sugar phosphate isomerase/epimerase [Raineyella sp. W15-4]|uniref:sugar phosphate isomerase/epimerase family protein n=1 Tax=Raineyella sp. W15-4 TaxID=3081651 RepID=UPI0029545832|nr:sugar phosphate isomerase/epimerase [Raineyella sp. W15-4]WOQ17103.1 sugar phosphate isomerase/epimerase [Raineyella sp. W15-4]
MKLGMFTTCLHDRDLDGAIEVAHQLGHTSLELNSGGFFRDYHIHTSALLVSEHARSEFLGKLSAAGMSLTSLNNNGNPLHPDREVGPRHLREMHDAIDLAALLGVGVVVMQSGNPGAEPTSTVPSWVVSPWDSAYIDVLDYQWSLAVPLWKEIAAHATDRGIKLAIEMHPHQLVYSPTTLARLIEETGAESIGMEMDPSHLFWQGIDPVETIERFGDRVFMSAAKDTKIYEENLRKNGFLNNLWRRNEGPNKVAFTGRYTANDYPEDPSYEFVSIGRGHDVEFWSRWLAALNRVNPDISVQIEHEDPHMGRIEGLQFATESLNAAAAKAGLEFDKPTY